MLSTKNQMLSNIIDNSTTNTERDSMWASMLKMAWNNKEKSQQHFYPFCPSNTRNIYYLWKYDTSVLSFGLNQFPLPT